MMRFFITLMCLLIAATNTGAEEISPRQLYRTALVRSRTMLTPGIELVHLSDFRSTIRDFERISMLFPDSIYGQYSLWSASGVALEAYERHHKPEDRENGLRLLEQLVRVQRAIIRTSQIFDRRTRFEEAHSSAWLDEFIRQIIGNVVRVTIPVSEIVEFSSHVASDPSRLRIDLKNTIASHHLRRSVFRYSDGPVHSIHVGTETNRSTRITLDTENVDRCNILALYDPYRLVIDCVPLRPEPLASLPVTAEFTLQQTPVLTSSPSLLSKHAPLEIFTDEEPLSLSRQLGLGVSRVVIDAGHGGYDPGASGAGLTESALVLDISHRLARRLTDDGFDVFLTRPDDEFVSLKTRSDLANNVDGDLFLSIHANASGREEARGVETYVLDFATDPQSRLTATRENAHSASTLAELDSLIEMITKTSKVQESETFAEIVQSSLINSLRVVDPSLPDLGVKRAPFLVLIRNEMPSVLAEISFVSNEEDANLLSNNAYRDLIADALLSAVRTYRNELRFPEQPPTLGEN